MEAQIVFVCSRGFKDHIERSGDLIFIQSELQLIIPTPTFP